MTFSPRVLSVGAVVVTLGCGRAPGSAPDTPLGDNVPASSQESYTRIVSVNTSGFTEPAELVLRDRDALDNAWRTLNNGIAGNPAPAVDLTRQTVILLALGERRTGGYTIRLDSLRVAANDATVHYTVASPGTDCMTTQMITSPVDGVIVPRIAGNVRFVRHEVVTRC